MSRGWLNVVAAAAAIALGFLAAPADASALQLSGTVSEVVDGDTIKVAAATSPTATSR